jgi:hypothetical protein
MTDAKNIDGHFYPLPHPGWGGFADELFHYTSRYYKTVEAFLRSVARDDTFTMTGYKAEMLSLAQREAMAAVLAYPPDSDSAGALVTIIDAVLTGSDAVDPAILQRFPSPVADHPAPAAVRDRHVEVPMHQLARHLESPNSTLRANLHNAVIALHNNGYVLRNHPGLRHDEAQAILDP